MKIGDIVKWKAATVRAWDEAPPEGHKIEFGWCVYEDMKREKYEVLMVWHQANWTSAFCRGNKLTNGVGFLCEIVEMRVAEEWSYEMLCTTPGSSASRGSRGQHCHWQY